MSVDSQVDPGSGRESQNNLPEIGPEHGQATAGVLGQKDAEHEGDRNRGSDGFVPGTETMAVIFESSVTHKLVSLCLLAIKGRGTK